MDYLGVGQLVGGLVQGVASAADPYFFTEQEKANAQLQVTSLQNQQDAINANVTVATKKEETTQKAIQYGLVGVLGVSCVYLASKFIGGK